MGNLLRSLILAALAALFAGCPESSAPDVQGTWDVTYTRADGTTISGVAAIIVGGPGFIYTDDGNLYGIVTPLTDVRSVQGGMVKYPPQCLGTTCPFASIGFAGTAYADHIGLSLDNVIACIDVCPQGNPAGGTMELDRSNPPLPGYIPLVDQTDAQWQGYYLPSDTALTLTNKAGSLTGTDAFGCAVTLLVEHITMSSSSPIHEVNLALVIMKGSFDPFTSKCDANLTGVGYYSTQGTGPFAGTPGVYFFAGVYAEFTGSMFEFKVK